MAKEKHIKKTIQSFDDIEDYMLCTRCGHKVSISELKKKAEETAKTLEQKYKQSGLSIMWDANF